MKTLLVNFNNYTKYYEFSKTKVKENQLLSGWYAQVTASKI